MASFKKSRRQLQLLVRLTQNLRPALGSGCPIGEFIARAQRGKIRGALVEERLRIGDGRVIDRRTYLGQKIFQD